jgi:hypothetical protein
VAGREWLAAACVALCAALLYLPTARNGYVLDDPVIVRDNAVVFDMQVGRALTRPYWPEGSPPAPNWRPLAMLSFVGDRWLGGAGAAAVHHAVNALLHGLTVLALFPLARRLAGRWAIAALVLFAAHPAHAESVAPIVGRCDLIAALGAFLALECFLRYRDGATAWWLAAGAAAYAIGLGGKESAAPVVALLPAADVLLRGTPPRAIAGRGAVAYLPFVAVAALYLAGRVMVLGDSSFRHAGELEHGLVERLVLAARNAVLSAGLLLVPVRFHHTLTTLPINAPFGFRDPQGLAALAWSAGGLLAGLGWIALLRRAPRAAFLWLGALVTWLPVSGILPAAAGVSMRFLFLPSAFLACGIARGMDRAASRRPVVRPWLAGATVALAACGSWLGLRRSAQWHDNGTFYASVLAESPDCYAAHQSMGTWHASRKPADMDLARAHYLRAIAIAGETDWGVLSRLDLATTYGAAEAERRIREIVARYPDRARPHFYLGQVLEARGRRAEAIEHLQRAHEIDPALRR